ncbi:rhamnulose-1-phosphate aldolase [Parageobacillus thermoglucosidasius]|uniref:Rhamnulose-1-phosphate aldolase n=2 Tax=Anoxybacillaceae TaxID=3120669 RepID=A0AAN0YMM7_PARTM|nr:rhamnulose-1-phosphate aldolase [Parageobacillus thermoglucosidasius]AEH49396.1 rhamnulose-1-phosphate aldolase [Parageobacillus thermoglucosidasius C56-YS93]ALF09443.1 rhamnulose-1-phosphate aldolase [Parageobacillus thermoglucosidasius]ANZ29526.1 rhamnulose-1-phosphate aldolase [Parageobacillus thermoglucosidasius]APM80264.1 rhamnulose-1-phosphate aldolase [Parageobacillus thermoglucosidasius]KJX70195.1 rhamnulose-1-phosphate aldolase [Parageobacillus thermoglucosidasius]
MTGKLDILTAEFTQEMMKTTANLYRLGWDERNGGNISYLLKEEEVIPFLDINHVKRTMPIHFDASALAGKYFIVTGSGKYFKNVMDKPAENLGVIRVTEDGKAVDVLWGFEDGGGPTSELPTHFMSHIERLKADPNHRVIIHCHATHILGMTFTHSLDEKAFTKTLWQMCTECIVVFPEGVGIIPWMVPGTDAIGKATAAKMKDVRLVVWPHHGVFGAGTTMDEAFGLIETAEKAAQVYTIVCAQGGVKQAITDQQLLELADAFGVVPRQGILNTKK